MKTLYGSNNGVDAFGYYSAGSEQILMKSVALWTHCLDWPWQILGAICAVTTV